MTISIERALEGYHHGGPSVPDRLRAVLPKIVYVKGVFARPAILSEKIWREVPILTQTEGVREDDIAHLIELGRGLFDLLDTVVPSMESARDFYPKFDMLLRLFPTWGNQKIPDDHLILNMGPGVLCPSDMSGYCELGLWGGTDSAVPNLRGSCYALNTERMRHTALMNRLIAMIQWWTMPPSWYAELILALVRTRGVPVKFVRFNESGNLWGQPGFDKMVEICEIVHRRRPDLHFYTYTHNPHIDITHAPAYLAINLSERRHFTLGRKVIKADNVFGVLYPNQALLASLRGKYGGRKKGAKEALMAAEKAIGDTWIEGIREDVQKFERTGGNPRLLGRMCKLSCHVCDLCKVHTPGKPRGIYIPHHTERNKYYLEKLKQGPMATMLGKFGLKLPAKKVKESDEYTPPSVP